MTKLLLHTCCGPCFLGSYEGLKSKDFDIVSYFYNPNIQPENEKELRIKNLEIAALDKAKEIIVGEYDPGEHARAIRGLEKEFPKRCLECYKLRLIKTAQRAKEEKIELFSTTLLVSPYQQHEELKNIGRAVSETVGVEFYYQDLRPFFREGQEVACKNNIYRQKYCGCLFSLRENLN